MSRMTTSNRALSIQRQLVGARPVHDVSSLSTRTRFKYLQIEGRTYILFAELWGNGEAGRIEQVLFDKEGIRTGVKVFRRRGPGEGIDQAISGPISGRVEYL